MAKDLEFKLYGDWDKSQRFMANLPQIVETVARRTAVKAGLLGEGIVKKFLGSQTLNWTPLTEKTLKRKERKGGSNAILIDTSSYFQSITTWSDSEGAYIGVKKTAKNKEGDEIANIAAVHEYGSLVRGIPARPLWQPTLEKLEQTLQSRNLFDEEFRKEAAKYGMT